ncbi:oxygen-insensitive NADPH nitroreductase [Brevibacillus nitrificans]|uniref:oxygen-insensitive NADPH nitroreductase n=1 Tax=Brevibacillus nitrificans TaxID=651560 RepID=UPI002604EEFC|nr:oxygen-insensitive NADPH nitroreductase [Brevibacillus nitrificans]
MTNETVALIQGHKSIRKYTDEPVSEEILEALFASAQWAPTSHNVQAYSIIRVKDKETQRRLAELCSQRFIGTSPVLLVFCADFHRLQMTCEMHGTHFTLGEPEDLLVGAVDTALAAQNVMIAARSFGLGGVMIGGIRDNPEKVSELLKLPRYTMPIMGMCLGYPAEDPLQKPRLPQSTVIHEDSYRSDRTLEGLEQYETISSAYYQKRTNGKETRGWTMQMAEYFNTARRANIRAYVENQGLLNK